MMPLGTRVAGNQSNNCYGYIDRLSSFHTILQAYTIRYHGISKAIQSGSQSECHERKCDSS